MYLFENNASFCRSEAFLPKLFALLYGSEEKYQRKESFVINMSNGSFGVPDEYIVFDLETTGFSPSCAEIIEIGAIKVSGGGSVDVFHSYIRPICGIPPNITALTGIKPSDVACAPDAASVIPDFLRFTAGSVLVAHNSPFDRRFISAYSEVLGLSFDNEVQDSLKLARQYIRSKSYKLEVLKDMLGLSFPSHNAVDDCRVTAYLVEHCRRLSRVSEMRC